MMALWLLGGDPKWGGDSRQVQEQLVRVQQIQATSYAFAAILHNGSVVTWGDPDRGSDSRQVREKLVRVQQIQSTSSAFAAILHDGSLVTWGYPVGGGDALGLRLNLTGCDTARRCAVLV